jgi:hypothetical protein
MQYRSLYSTLQPPARLAIAKRIFNLYLKQNSEYPINWPKCATETIPVSLVIDVVRYSIDNPDANVFDDISFLSLQAMEKIYNGSFIYEELPIGKAVPLFRNSVFYNMMRSDLRIYF